MELPSWGDLSGGKIRDLDQSDIPDLERRFQSNLAKSGLSAKQQATAVRDYQQRTRKELPKHVPGSLLARRLLFFFRKLTGRVKYLPALVLPLCALAACATTPTKLSDSSPVRSDRFLPDYRLYAKPLPHGVKAVVVRDDGYLGSAVKTTVVIDGHPLAGLFQNNRLDFYLTAGDHIVAIKLSPDLGQGSKEHQFVFHADQTSYFRITVDNGGFDIQPTTQIQ